MYGWVLPNGIVPHDVTLWLDGLDNGFADRILHTSFAQVGVTKGVAIKDGTEMIFDGATSFITGGNIGNVNTVCFWLKPNGANQNIINMDGTLNIDISAGTVRANNWTSPTITVNGIQTATITNNVWSMIGINSSTSVATSVNTIGKIGAAFYTGSMTGIIYFNKVLTVSQINQLYMRQK